jgi:hypothetical protein
MSKRTNRFIRPIVAVAMPVFVIATVFSLMNLAQDNRSRVLSDRSVDKTVVLGETTGIKLTVQETVFDLTKLQTNVIVRITNDMGKTLQIDPSQFSVPTALGLMTPLPSTTQKVMSPTTLDSGAMTARLIFNTPVQATQIYFSYPGEPTQTISL